NACGATVHLRTRSRSPISERTAAMLCSQPSRQLRLSFPGGACMHRKRLTMHAGIIDKESALQPRESLGRSDYRRSYILPQNEQIFVAANNQISPGRNGGPENRVVIGVSADASR